MCGPAKFNHMCRIVQLKKLSLGKICATNTKNEHPATSNAHQQRLQQQEKCNRRTNMALKSMKQEQNSKEFNNKIHKSFSFWKAQEYAFICNKRITCSGQCEACSSP